MIVERARSGRALRAYLAFVVGFLILFVADGSRQPTSGPGWRLLGYQRGVAGDTPIFVIRSQTDLDVAWDALRIRTDPATLPTNATTIWITATGSIGCPAHFAGVHTDPTGVTAFFTLALTTGCDTKVVPDSFLVAVDNGRLPDGQFHVERVGPVGQPSLGVDLAR
jgi:hypothetical protein